MDALASCGMVVMTWNACGLESGAITDVVVILDDVYWDALLIQEGPFSEKSGRTVIQGGHQFYVSATVGKKRTCCILVHSRWGEYKQSFQAVSSRLAYLDLDVGDERKHRLTSVHLPDSSAPDDVYEASLLAVDQVITSARRAKRFNIVGMDANAVLGQREATDDPFLIGEFGVGQRNERGYDFSAWLHGVRLTAVTTMIDKPGEETWTHELWSTRLRRQIDFILLDEVRANAAEDVGTVDAIRGASDHRGVFARLKLEPYVPIERKRTKVQVGWQPRLNNDGKPNDYHEALDDVVGNFNCSVDDGTLVQQVVDAATLTAAAAPSTKRQHCEEVTRLFAARREEQSTVRRRELTKKLWKALRRQRRKQEDDDLDILVKAGCGLKKLRQTTQKHKGIERVSGLRDNTGNLKTDPDDMCEVFAHFYEDLYKELDVGVDGFPEPSEVRHSSVTAEEVRDALKVLKNRKTGANDGLVAEMLKTKHEGLVGALAVFFDSILSDQLEIPDTWKLSTLKVIFKKGDAELPQNYRPISIIPVMAKLYSAILYRRIRDHVDGRLADEQFGFRRGRGCADAVHILRTVVEKSNEWGEELWLATLDVEKAFDRVHHSSIFGALLEGEVNMSIVAALRRMYSELKANVCLWPGAESRSFNVERGVRQGDPLSPLLFNLMLDQVLREVGAIWRRRGYGTNVGQKLAGERLTHIAFADDMTVVARSWLSMKRMLDMLKTALARRGLRLHPSKCKAQTNNAQWPHRGDVAISDDFTVRVLAHDEELELLGTSLSLTDATNREIMRRIAKAWRMFWSLKALLLKRDSSLNRRLRLFDATVGCTATWCCESWSPRVEELRKLEVARRSMLRKIVAMPRGTEEDWLDWMQRSTHASLKRADTANVRRWCEFHFQRKWLWGGHVARRGWDTWLYQVSSWRDSAWQMLAMQAGGHRELRPSSRRWMKWEDPLRRFCAAEGRTCWTTLANHKEEWVSLASDFCAWSVH